MGAPTVETPRGASLRRRPRPCSLRRPAGAPWQLGSSSPPRRRPTGRLYSGGPDGIATFETPSQVFVPLGRLALRSLTLGPSPLRGEGGPRERSLPNSAKSVQLRSPSPRSGEGARG